MRAIGFCPFPFVWVWFISRFLMLKSLLNLRALSSSAALLAALLLQTSYLLADAVILKSGERIEGKILSETDTEISIQYMVSATIKDERTVKKADVDKVEKAAPDIEAWSLVKDFKLSEDSLDAATYTHYINSLRGFATQFPASAYAAAAKTAADAIEAEKKRVDSGEFKFDGKWLTKEEVQKERTQILGSSYLRQMKKHAAAGRLQDSIMAFEALEKQAAGSAAYPEAIDIARRTLIALKQASDAGLVRLKAQAIEEKKTLEKLVEPQRSQTAKELKYLRDRTEANVAALERLLPKWMPLSPATEKSLNDISAKAGNEIIRLASLPTENMKLSLREVEKGKAAVAAGDLPAAEVIFSKATQLWGTNEQIPRGMALVAAAKKAGEEKTAAEKMAAEDAKKRAIEATEAAAKARLVEVKPTPTPAPTETVPEAEEPKKEESFFSKPAAWIILAVLIAFGAIIRKAFNKFKDPSGNILDQ